MEPLRELEKTMKCLTRSFLNRANQSPLSNPAIYDCLHQFAKQDCNTRYLDTLWENVITWIEDEKILLQEENSRTPGLNQRINLSSAYSFQKGDSKRTEEFNELQVTFQVLIKDIKKSCEIVNIEQVLKFHKCLKHLPYAHFGPLIMKLWKVFHGLENEVDLGNTFTPKISSLEQFDSLVNADVKDCFQCCAKNGIPSYTFTLRSFTQHIFEKHSLYWYHCDQANCEEKRTCQRLINSHLVHEHGKCVACGNICGNSDFLEEHRKTCVKYKAKKMQGSKRPNNNKESSEDCENIQAQHTTTRKESPLKKSPIPLKESRTSNRADNGSLSLCNSPIWSSLEPRPASSTHSTPLNPFESTGVPDPSSRIDHRQCQLELKQKDDLICVQKGVIQGLLKYIGEISHQVNVRVSVDKNGPAGIKSRLQIFPIIPNLGLVSSNSSNEKEASISIPGVPAASDDDMDFDGFTLDELIDCIDYNKLLALGNLEWK